MLTTCEDPIECPLWAKKQPFRKRALSVGSTVEYRRDQSRCGTVDRILGGNTFACELYTHTRGLSDLIPSQNEEVDDE